jgi:hypothetical protein
MSLNKRLISNQLKRLETLYNLSAVNSDIEHQNFYSKLAILECAGWVEDCMDLIAQKHVTRGHVRNRATQDHIKYIVDHTYGFEYERHFKRMLCQIIGVVKFYKIEKSIDSIILSTFTGALDSLKVLRDGHAHTYILRASQPFYDPSWTLGVFANLYPGLKEFYNKI